MRRALDAAAFTGEILASAKPRPTITVKTALFISFPLHVSAECGANIAALPCQAKLDRIVRFSLTVRVTLTRKLP